MKKLLLPMVILVALLAVLWRFLDYLAWKR